MANTKLYKDGDHMVIKTDAKTERDFIDDMSRLFSSMIAKGFFMDLSLYADQNEKALKVINSEQPAGEDRMHWETLFNNDWTFQFSYWLPEIVDICCKLRGYKNGVFEKRILIAGTPSVDQMDPIATVYEKTEHEKAKAVEDSPEKGA